MNSTKSDISLINHDIKNCVGVAITYLQFLTGNNPELVVDKNIERAMEGLKRAIALSHEIASLTMSEIKGKPDASEINSLITIDLNRHLENKTKPIYEKLRKRFDIAIIDTYETIDETKFILINHSLIMKFRENIISNAINSGASKIEIHHEMKEYCGVATYHDNGKGMSQDELDKLPLLLHGDGVINGLGTANIFKASQEIGFHISYASVENEGTTIRIIYPYVSV